jgi:GNAT superfamily N-acetyltransferase
VRSSDALDETLLAQIEDAGLNASAPPQQRWLDGWLLRFSPGKAKRARCINAVAVGRLPLAEKLRRSAAAYLESGLPLVVRITRFSQPAGLDEQLAALGLTAFDDTRVMVCPVLPTTGLPPVPPATRWVALDAAAYAEAVGNLRGSPAAQRAAHAQRLTLSPVPYRGFAIRRGGDGAILACGQFAIEAEFVGLYDVQTRDDQRGNGFGTLLCQRLLSLAALCGAKIGYLQVEGDNHPARHIYERLGFADGYRYHYRQRPP